MKKSFFLLPLLPALLCLIIPVMLCFGFIGQDTFHVLTWWACIFVIGLIFMPLSAKVFSRFFDKGYLFSKTLGIALLTLFLWFFSSLKILPFYSIIVYLVVIAAAVVVLFPLKGLDYYKSIIKDKSSIKTFIYEEALFLLCLAFFAFVKGNGPGPDTGIEMRMDYALLNNLLNTKFMPPVDMWFAGKPLNYYFYGQYVFAFLTKMSGISSTITYNLSMATLFAFAFSLTFSITGNLIYIYSRKSFAKIILAGLISAFIISLGSNFHTPMYSAILPFAKSIGIYNGPINPPDRAGYFYADPRSFVGQNPDLGDGGITEFPAYSLVLGDLHAQIIDMIFVLTFVALLLAFLVRSLQEERNSTLRPKWYSMPIENILMILLLPVMWMTNAWDFPIYVTVTGAVLLYINLVKYDFSFESVLVTIISTAKITILALILLIPFFLNFYNPTQGTSITNLKHLLNPVYIYQMLVTWGYQIVFVIGFMIYIFRTEKRYRVQAAANILKKNVKQQKVVLSKNRTKGFAGWLKRTFSGISTPDIFILIISICAIGLVLIPEFIYQKDATAGGNLYRANTMWKVTLQAFILFDIAIGFIAVRIFEVKRSIISKGILGVLIASVFFGVVSFSYWGLRTPYGDLKEYKGLDMTPMLKARYADDYEAIQWLKTNATGQPVVLEANGDAYTDYTRLCQSTGFPTILGWFGHQQFWRGSKGDKELGERASDVAAIYESDDIDATKNLLGKYEVKYIAVGKFEREKYPNLKEEKLSSLGKVAFQYGTIKIIELD